MRPVSAASGTGSPRLPLSRVLGREAAAVPDPDSAPPRGTCLFPARPSCQRGRLAGHGGPRPLCARRGLGSGPGRGAPGSPAELSSSGLWRRLCLSAPQQKVAGGPWASPRCLVDASDVRFPRQQCLGEPRRAVGETQVALAKELEILEVSRQGGDHDPGPRGVGSSRRPTPTGRDQGITPGEPEFPTPERGDVERTLVGTWGPGWSPGAG